MTDCGPSGPRERLRQCLQEELWDDAIDCLELVAELAESPDAKVEALAEGAGLAETKLESLTRAVDLWERVARIDANHAPALAALERLYTQLENHEGLRTLEELRHPQRHDAPPPRVEERPAPAAPRDRRAALRLEVPPGSMPAPSRLPRPDHWWHVYGVLALAGLCLLRVGIIGLWEVPRLERTAAHGKSVSNKGGPEVTPEAMRKAIPRVRRDMLREGGTALFLLLGILLWRRRPKGLFWWSVGVTVLVSAVFFLAQLDVFRAIVVANQTMERHNTTAYLPLLFSYVGTGGVLMVMLSDLYGPL
jgi:hypothetical protein